MGDNLSRNKREISANSMYDIQLREKIRIFTFGMKGTEGSCLLKFRFILVFPYVCVVFVCVLCLCVKLL